MFKTEDYSYDLPADLISQRPSLEQGKSNLLVFSRENGSINHSKFDKLNYFLKPTDVLVVNDTKVVPARLLGFKETGGNVEVLILNFSDMYKKLSKNPVIFECLIKSSKKNKLGSKLFFDGGLESIILKFINGIYSVKFSNGILLERVMYKFGKIPVPPYIKREKKGCNKEDLIRYQTVFSHKDGSIAAPTAGLHFSPIILTHLKKIGIKIVKITLHVGYGTFSSVRVGDIRDHKIHSESFFVSEEAAKSINNAKKIGSRIIAVGTTSVRTLEYLGQKDGIVRASEGKCDLFIYPGYKFKIVDAMITNFHLPNSTLFMLVSAFSTIKSMLNVYELAIKKKYHFFSYGDAMLIF